MPEAGLSVPRAQTRRTEDRSESVSGARHSYAGPRPVRAGPSDPVDARAIARDGGPAGRAAGGGGSSAGRATASGGSAGRAAGGGGSSAGRATAGGGSSAGRAAASGGSAGRVAGSGGSAGRAAAGGGSAGRVAAKRGSAGRVAANGGAAGRAAANAGSAAAGPISREVGRSAEPDPARRAYTGAARPSSRDGARPRPREALRPGSREAVRRDRAVAGPRQPTRPADHASSAPTGAAVPGRRTVRIQGRGSERYRPSPNRQRPHRRRHERDGFKPDRAAMWAVLLGVVLILVAATSSRAAVGFRVAASGRARVALHGGQDARARVGGVARPVQAPATRCPGRLGDR
jgi:hypothetical protein